jgi:uncharacterized protein with HEPN domain
MSKRNTHLLLADMRLACERIIQYTAGMEYEKFITDSKTTDATVRNIQILGEAAGQIPKPFQLAHPEIEWTKIIRSRHILVHEYFELDYQIIWKIVQEYIPPLLDNLRQLVTEG